MPDDEIVFEPADPRQRQPASWLTLGVAWLLAVVVLVPLFLNPEGPAGILVAAPTWSSGPILVGLLAYRWSSPPGPAGLEAPASQYVSGGLLFAAASFYAIFVVTALLSWVLDLESSGGGLF